MAYEQPAQGYRVAVEAPLLARFSIEGRRRRIEHVLDLGAGPGALGLMLLATGWAHRVTAVERDAVHAELCRRNAERNGFGASLSVVHESLGAPARGRSHDLVISNPPWFEAAEGPVAEHGRRAHARTWLDADVQRLCTAARAAMKPGGRFVVSWPSQALPKLLRTAAAEGLHGKRLRLVHPRPSREAQVAFVELVVGARGGLVVAPPCVLRIDGEAYAPEVRDALEGCWPSPAS